MTLSHRRCAFGSHHLQPIAYVSFETMQKQIFRCSLTSTILKMLFLPKMDVLKEHVFRVIFIRFKKLEGARRCSSYLLGPYAQFTSEIFQHVTSPSRTPLIYQTRTPRVETPIFHAEEFALGMHGSKRALSIKYLSAVGSQ